MQKHIILMAGCMQPSLVQSRCAKLFLEIASQEFVSRGVPSTLHIVSRSR